MTDKRGGDASQELPGLAERLDWLFNNVPRSASDPRLHSSISAAEALREAGVSVTHTHIRALRSGQRANPSAVLIAGLARLFRVPVTYFLDPDGAEGIQESVKVTEAIRDSGAQQIALRAHGISKQSLDAILGVLDDIRRLEGLDTDEQ